MQLPSKLNSTIFALIFASIAMLFPASALAAPISIDDFTEGNLSLAQSTVGSTSASQPGLNVLGGTRDTTLTVTAAGMLGDSSFQVASGLGLAALFEDAGFNSEVSLTYDGGGSLNADFSGQARIRIVIDLADASSTPTNITVSISDTGTATAIVALNTAGPTTVDIPFSSFVGIGSVDLTAVTSVQVTIDPQNPGSDLLLASISTFEIPEPTSLLLWGALSVGGGAWYMRRRKAAPAA